MAIRRRLVTIVGVKLGSNAGGIWFRAAGGHQGVTRVLLRR